jgi:hypothetical protein
MIDDCRPARSLARRRKGDTHGFLSHDLRWRLTRFRGERALVRASTSAPLDLRRSAMRTTSSSERMAGRPTERATA